MNALLRWSFAAAALAASSTPLARSSCELTSPAWESWQTVNFGVVNPAESVSSSGTNATQASTFTADDSTNGQHRPVGGQFFRVDGAPPRQLNHSSAQRRAVRVSLQQRYPDLAQAVGMSASTAEKLLDVLTEHQLAGQIAAPSASSDWLLQEALAATKRLEALRAVLSKEALEHYVDYSTTLRERAQVSAFNACLPSDYKLRAAQIEQMIALYQEDNTRQQRSRHNRRFPRRYDPLSSGLQTDDLQRAAQLATIAANEERLRAMSQSHAWFSQHAAEFMTMPQLAVLSQMHAAREQGLRQWLGKARLKAGLDAAIPDRPVPADEQSGIPVTLASQVKVDIKLSVNRNDPIVGSHIVTNGEPVTLEAGDGLLVELTSSFYDDDSLNVHWAYYEQQTLRKRRLTDTTSVSTLPPEGAPREIKNFTVTTGSKVYAITANVSVATL